METKIYNYAFNDNGVKDARMLDLILFKSMSVDNYTIPGDSGSLIVDKNDNVIGIHIGGYKSTSVKFCYAVYIKEILQISAIK